MRKQKIFLIVMLAGVIGIGLVSKKAFAQTFPLPAPNSGSGASTNNIYFVTADGPAEAATCWNIIERISGVTYVRRGCHYDPSSLPNPFNAGCNATDHIAAFASASRPGASVTGYPMGLVSGSPDLWCGGSMPLPIPSGVTATPCTIRVVRACLRTSSLLNATEP